MKQLSLLLASLVLASCFSAPKINEEFNKSDLSANLVDSLDVYTNSLYKMPKAYTNDYIIATIRMNALNVEYAKIPVIIQLNLLAAANASEYNFDYIKERLSDREMNEFISIFPDSLIKRHSIDDEKSRHKILAEQLTCKPEIVDAHWAEYSVTGDSRIIDKMIGSIRPDVPCCITCIEWSVPSMATQNRDVYKHVTRMYEAMDPKSRSWFQRFIPEKSDCNWLTLEEIQMLQ